jgi:hypothetical protein
MSDRIIRTEAVCKPVEWRVGEYTLQLDSDGEYRISNHEMGEGAIRIKDRKNLELVKWMIDAALEDKEP